MMALLLLLAVEASAQQTPVFWLWGISSLLYLIEGEAVNIPIYVTQELLEDLTISYRIRETATGGVDYRIPGANYRAGTGTFTIPSGMPRDRPMDWC